MTYTTTRPADGQELSAPSTKSFKSTFYQEYGSQKTQHRLFKSKSGLKGVCQSRDQSKEINTDLIHL